MVDPNRAGQPPASSAPRKPAFRGLMAIWSDWMDRNGPRNPAARFAVDLLPWLAILAILAVIYLLAR